MYFVTTFVFPFIRDAIGYDYVFLIFSFLNLLACYFVFYYLPETRGVDIEEAYKLVDDMFDSAPSFDCRTCVCRGAKAKGSGKRPNLCCWEGFGNADRAEYGSSRAAGAMGGGGSPFSNVGETLSYYNPISDAVEEESSSLLRYTD